MNKNDNTSKVCRWLSRGSKVCCFFCLEKKGGGEAIKPKKKKNIRNATTFNYTELT